MPGHDEYGKAVMKAAVGADWIASGKGLLVGFGAGPEGRLDGMIGSEIAVEIESREPKQVRGAILDLVFHQAPKKLLVLIPAYNDPETMEPQARLIFRKWLKNARAFGVVALTGTGDRRHLEADCRRVRAALRELGWQPTSTPVRAEVYRAKHPTADDFKRQIHAVWSEAESRRAASITLSAGHIHRAVGGYPGPRHRMPDCCTVMMRLMEDGDRVLSSPPSGHGASLTIRYALPRKSEV